MSGTSLDGLDIAYVEFEYSQEKWHFVLGPAETIPYPSKWKDKLLKSVEMSAEDLCILDAELGTLFGRWVKDFMERHTIQPAYICSHGHTIFHQPEKHVTHQIGNPQLLAVATGVPVVAQFRNKDVVLGGQGAPLVPIGDRLLFGNYSACLNLGGISNISYEKKGERIAYDVSVANMLLNTIAGKVGLDYDRDGQLASEGKVNRDLLSSMSKIHLGKKDVKFSLGFEWVSKHYFPLLTFPIPTEDLMATAVEHITQVLTDEFEENVPKGNILVTGGGAFNTFLMQQLKQKLSHEYTIESPGPQIIAFKEAIVFGLLGVLRLRNEVNCLKSVTGASSDNSGGVIFTP